MDDSMYIEDIHDPLSIGASSLSDAQQERLKRYSVIGNDPSFKQYTKNHDYDAIKYQSSQRKEKGQVEENILTVTLKDLNMPSAGENATGSEFAFNSAETDEDEGGLVREQYRVIKKDLLFRVNFQQNNNKFRHGENQVVSERTLSDFRKLATSL